MSRLGRPRLHLRSIGSTNARARELAQAGAPHGTAVPADEQTAGRGRQGRGWSTPPGGALAVSLVIRDPNPLLSLRAGLAVADLAGELSRSLETLIGLFDVLALIAVVIGALGIVNTLGIGISERVREIARRFSPIVVVASIDEMFLDFTGCERLHARPGPVRRARHEPRRRRPAAAVAARGPAP